MKKKERKYNYQGVSFSIPFMEKIKQHIAEDGKYRTVTDYIRQATREKMDREKSERERELLFSREQQLSKEVGEMLTSGASRKDIDKKLDELLKEQRKISLKMKEVLRVSLEEK